MIICKLITFCCRILFFNQDVFFRSPRYGSKGTADFFHTCRHLSLIRCDNNRLSNTRNFCDYFRRRLSTDTCSVEKVSVQIKDGKTNCGSRIQTNNDIRCFFGERKVANLILSFRDDMNLNVSGFHSGNRNIRSWSAN